MRRLLLASFGLMMLFAGAVAQGEPGDEYYVPPPPNFDDKKWHDPNNPFHWYPMECCHLQDCAGATKVERVSEWNGRWVTTKHGRVWVPDKKKAFTIKDKDNKDIDFMIPAFENVRIHVCMRKKQHSDPKPEHGDMHVICLFQESGG